MSKAVSAEKRVDKVLIFRKTGFCNYLIINNLRFWASRYLFVALAIAQISAYLCIRQTTISVFMLKINL